MKIVADINIPFVEEAFNTVGDVNTVVGRDINTAQLKDAEILLVRSVTPVDESLLKKTNIRFVATATIGVDHIDIDYLQQNSIGFASAPGSNAVSAAEYVISALIYYARQHNVNLSDKTVGIVGCGNVGSKVLNMLQAMDVDCLVYDPPRAEQFADREYVTWEQIMTADIVTAHVPLQQAGQHPTFHMFDKSFFQQLKPNAVFINTSRGRVVEETELLEVLLSRQDLYLVLDVWQNEPDISLELLKQTAIATPHIAGYSLDGKVRGTEMVYKAVCDFLGVGPGWQIPPLPFPETFTAMQFNGRQTDREVIESVIKNAYDIVHDHEQMQSLLTLAPPQRAIQFDLIRKNYPIRREFPCYEVIVSDKRKTLINTLTGLGFKVEVSKALI